MCIAAVGLVGDIARALGSNILNHSNLFMQILLENLAVSKWSILLKSDIKLCHEMFKTQVE